MLGLALKHAQAFSNQPFAEPSIKTCPEPESNQRHEDFQSSALPTELRNQNGGLDGARTRDLRRDRAAF